MPPKILAKPGEVVRCRNGHEVATVRNNIHNGDHMLPRHFKVISGAPLVEEQAGVAPICATCGDRWLDTFQKLLMFR